ncbi:MAG TPA: tetratricopeptide repeat protein [Bryobacteraceae bacterium]|nr:tetratricopeptide repeat protein [Bryobacteraceae bacterium]
MRFWRLPLFFLTVFAVSTHLTAATILVLEFHNTSQYPDLNWVGESISQTLIEEFAERGEIALDRSARLEGLRRLSLKPGADFTKASLIRLGQTLDADEICYGSYDATLPRADAALKDGAIRVSAHVLDLRKLHDGPEISEAGQLAELSRLEQHLAWSLLKYLQPTAKFTEDQFLNPRKLIRLDSEESYIRGLLSSNPEQGQKWFLQAAQLDPQFTSPAFELGKLALERKDYKQAIDWLQHVPPADPRYATARFKMGLAAYGASDYAASAGYFRELVKSYPLNEVYNDLGAAENQLGLPVAIDEFRHALDGDPNDLVYRFNLGTALLRNNYFDEAVKRLETVADRAPQDHEAAALLARARRHEPSASNAKPLAPERLKENFDSTAFRQLKSLLKSNASQ